MKINDLRSKSVAELNEALVETHREQFNLKMQKATGQLAKPSLIQENRRTIARIHTLLSQQGVRA